MFHTENGTPCFHEAESIPEIKRIVSEYEPGLVIELGTKNGGLTEYLQDATDSPIWSYDIIALPLGKKFRDNVIFCITDILSKPHNSLIELCKLNVKKILYCDNGNKIKEFKMYAQYLNKGDILGVHDWGTEINYDAVKEVLTDFEPYESDFFIENKLKTRFWKRG